MVGQPRHLFCQTRYKRRAFIFGKFRYSLCHTRCEREHRKQDPNSRQRTLISLVSSSSLHKSHSYSIRWPLTGLYISNSQIKTKQSRPIGFQHGIKAQGGRGVTLIYNYYTILYRSWSLLEVLKVKSFLSYRVTSNFTSIAVCSTIRLNIWHKTW